MALKILHTGLLNKRLDPRYSILISTKNATTVTYNSADCNVYIVFHWTARYLVVDHHVDRAMRGVGRQLAEVEGLVHDPLTGEGCIAVYQDRHHLGGTGP